MQRAQTRAVFIATPIARHPTRQYAMSLARTFATLTETGIRGYLQTVVGSSNLPRARNELVAEFLASDFTDLLWIDDDMGWEPGAVIRLLASGQSLIGGVGARKRPLADADPEKWCVRVDRGRRLVQDAFGAVQVDAIGTGFLKVERCVFEALAQAYPARRRQGFATMPAAARARYHGFYRFDDSPEEWGEDFQFCRDWTALGGTCWADPMIRLVHSGEAEYGGDFAAMFQPAGEDAACAS